MVDIREGKFKRFLRENCNVGPNNVVLVGVSGGVDSVVLCELLYRLRQPFAMAHVNYKLRGKESDGDETFVKILAKKYGVELYTESFKTSEYAKKHKTSIQIAARELRFDWFESLRKTYDYDVIAIASHQGDSVETFFINLMRGTGLEGLSGIKPRLNYIVHPLLFLTKEDILLYAQKYQLKYREDSSNKSLKYTRNKIRHQLIPLLEELQPDLLEKITQFSQIALEHTNFLEKLSRDYAQKAFTHKEDRDILRVREQDGSFIPEILLHQLLKPYKLEHKQLFKLHQALDKPGKKFISSTHIIWVDRDHLIIEEKKIKPIQLAIYKISIDQQYSSPFAMDVRLIKNKSSLPFKNTKIAYLNAAHVTFPLTLRKWRAGDVFQPFGMKGKKKISDYLTDKKVSRADKDNTWVLISGDIIVWVVGIGISETCRVYSTTTDVVKIEIKS